MKKLFFSALVAVVAVGGAYADSPISLYPKNSGTASYNCVTEAPTSCATISGTYYQPNSEIVIPTTAYDELFYN